MTSKLVSLSHTVLIRIDRITMIAINMSSERTKCWEKNLAMFAIGPALVNRFVVWKGFSAGEPLEAVLALVYLTFTWDSVWALLVFSFNTFNQFIQLVNLYYCWHNVLPSTFCPCLRRMTKSGYVITGPRRNNGRNGSTKWARTFKLTTLHSK